LDYVRDHPACARACEFSLEGMPDWIAQYPYAIQPWPLFLGAEKRRKLERASSGVVELLKTIPSRLLGNDPRRVARFYGMPNESLVGVLLEPPTGIANAVARCDLVDSADGIRCIEANVAANIGGWQVKFSAQQRLGHPHIHRFCEQSGTAVSYLDPVSELLRFVAMDTALQPFAREGEINVVVALSELQAEAADRTELDHLAELYQGVLRGLDFCGRLS